VNLFTKVADAKGNYAPRALVPPCGLHQRTGLHFGSVHSCLARRGSMGSLQGAPLLPNEPLSHDRAEWRAVGLNPSAMIAIPVLDVRRGICRSLQGRASLEFGTDPNQVLRALSRVGFSRFHIASCDAIGGPRGFRPSAAFLNDSAIQLQLATDLKRRHHIDDLLTAGASFVVVEPVCPSDDDCLADLLGGDSRAVIVMVDVCSRQLRTSAPNVSWPQDAADWIEEHLDVEIGAVLVRSVDPLGQLARCDLGFLEDLVDIVSTPVLAAGDLESLSDLDALQDRGVSGVLLGDGLYSGRINAWAAAQEYGS